MLKEAEMTDQTGVVYLREEPDSFSQVVPTGTVNIHQPTVSFRGTGEETRARPEAKPSYSRDLLPYQFLSKTTGAELPDFLALLAFLVSDIASDTALTHYRVTFQIANSVQATLHTQDIERPLHLTTKGTNSASMEAGRLREISGLTTESLAEIFGVSRTTYHKWISGTPLRNKNREHLLEVLALVEEATLRLGDANTTNTWLLTPVSPGGKKPVDYLKAREYALFRGFLLRTRTGREAFRPLAPSNRVHIKRSQEELEDALERLKPRVWIDDKEDGDMDTDDKEA